MNPLIRYSKIMLWVGVFLALLLGALLIRGTDGSRMIPLLFGCLYLLLTGLHIFDFMAGLIKGDHNAGRRGTASGGLGTVVVSALPVLLLASVLLLGDTLRGWRLASNPVALLLFVLSLRFMAARQINYVNAVGLLRGASPASAADGVAAQRREVSPNFSRAQRPIDVDDLDDPQPRSSSKRNLGKTTARPNFADATRPLDEE